MLETFGADYSPPMVAAIAIAIACGVTVLSPVNDSGFWLAGFLVVLIISFFL